MATQKLDALGLKCPQPTLKITIMASRLMQGDSLEVLADCPTFEKEVKAWCDRSNKVLLWIRDEGEGRNRCLIQF